VKDETPQAYTHRLLAFVEGQAPLAILHATAQTLQRLLHRVPDRTVRTRPEPDCWSAGDIIAHLADAEIVVGFRLRLILGEPGSPIIAYDQDRWVTSGHYDKRDPWRSLEQFRAMREANLALLDTLDPEQWTRDGVHSERGRESIEHMVQMLAGHDLNHVRQMRRVLARVGQC
jgi:DinB superfamily